MISFFVLGHILAIYHLAEIYAKGYAGRKNCNQAVEVNGVICVVLFML